ncbi:unnamed protein product [Cuscuta epithymum]|uniref:Retrotransposon Copia-like N-terminal domain-containing protein n=1 Tax=Cuscuta epithymum TaxID=186058 RepID=A0AAV0DS41_9ASTE|nr:unnamed protein product [Cuscuta epithymum]
MQPTNMAGEDKIDVASPYYLSSGDQPGNLITHVILTGDNYVAWARAITLSLKVRRKFVFVNGTINKPTEARKLLTWETLNSMFVSWILRSIDGKIAASIPYHVEAKPLWGYLERRYCVANGPRIQQLRADIVGCRQTKGMSVDDYFNRLMSLYDELERLKPLQSCSCGACKCEVAEKFAADRAEEKLHQFFIGIDDKYYGITRSNLLSQPMPVTLDRAYQAFIQEEKSKDIARGKALMQETQAFALRVEQPKSRDERVDKEKLVCSHCKKKGHEVGACFKLHGYPEWWMERNRNGKGTSSSRNGQGSSQNKKVAQAHVVKDEEVQTGTESLVAQLRPEHIQALLNLVNSDSKLANTDRMTGPTLGEPDWSR